MYATTQAKHDAIAQGISKIFKPVYDAEFRNQYPSETDFNRDHLQFMTLTFNQSQISLNDRIGLSTSHCPFSRSPTPSSTSFEGFNALPISKLLSIARKRGIQNADKLHKIDLIFAIQGVPGTFDPSLQRPIVEIRPKPHPLQVFQYLHFRTAKACLGGNLQRKLQYQPLALAYVDFESTRHGASVDPLKSEWVHVHAIMFVRTEHIEKFSEYVGQLRDHFQTKQWKREIGTLNQIWRQQGLSKEQHRHRLDLYKMARSRPTLRLEGDLAALRDMKCDGYNPSNPLAELFGYSSKGPGQVPMQLVRHGNSLREGIWAGAEDLYEVFPRQLNAIPRGR
jgi:hypothetical protein